MVVEIEVIVNVVVNVVIFIEIVVKEERKILLELSYNVKDEFRKEIG